MKVGRVQHKYMSLTVCVTTPEGIVMAADSRQTYRNNVGAARIGSDSATKIFPIGDRFGITVAGPAFLTDPSEPNVSPRSISYFINRFINQLSKEETVKTIAEKISGYLEKIYKPKEQLQKLEDQIKQQVEQSGGKVVTVTKTPNSDAVIIDFTDKDGKPQKGIGEIMPISLIVAGYDLEKVSKPELCVYLVYVPGQIKEVRKYGQVNEFGANWTGQTDVISRIVLGSDPRVNALEFVQEAKKKSGEEKITQQLQLLEYSINWGGMTLTDAIDFTKLMIETTSAIQRYSDGIALAPGDMPGVGGQVDIAVILPHDGFNWHRRKEIKLEKNNLK